MQPVRPNDTNYRQEIKHPEPKKAYPAGRSLLPHLQQVLDDELGVERPKVFSSVRFVPVLDGKGTWKLVPQIKQAHQ